jgi:hypothetical protein
MRQHGAHQGDARRRMHRRKTLRLLGFVVFRSAGSRASVAMARRIGAPPTPHEPAVPRSAHGWVERADAPSRDAPKKIRKYFRRNPRPAPRTPRRAPRYPPPSTWDAARCGSLRADDLEDRSAGRGTGHAPHGVAFDTSVIVADPGCPASIAGRAEVAPLTVVEELDDPDSRHDEVGGSARADGRHRLGPVRRRHHGQGRTPGA